MVNKGRFRSESREEFVLNRFERWKTGRGALWGWGVGLSLKVVGMGYPLSPFYKVNGTDTIASRAIASVKPNHSTALGRIEERTILCVGIMVGVCNVFEAPATTPAKRHRPDT